MNNTPPKGYNSWLEFYEQLRIQHRDLDSLEKVDVTVPSSNPVIHRTQPYDMKDIKAAAFDEIKDSLPTKADVQNLSDYIRAMVAATNNVDANVAHLKAKLEKLAI